MENGYATTPLALSGGTRYLVGLLERDGQVRMAIQDTSDPFGSAPGQEQRLGHILVDDLRHFVSDSMPVSLKTDPAAQDEVEAVFRVDGPFIHVRILPKDRPGDSTLLRREEFKAFAEGLLGPIATGAFFV